MMWWIEKITNLKLHDYQIAFLIDCLVSKRVVGVFARQSGKTTICSAFAVFYALRKEKRTVLVIGPTDRHVSIFAKRMQDYLTAPQVQPYVLRSTARHIEFKNGSEIKAMTTGDSGDNILGHTADMIVLEESSLIKDTIYTRIIFPMVMARNATIIKIGTPRGRNHFYESYRDKNYRSHKYNYTWCPSFTKEILEEYRLTATQLEFETEMNANFVEDADTYFKWSLIESSISDIQQYPEYTVHPKSEFFLGVDFASKGLDECVFIVIERPFTEPNMLYVRLIDSMKQNKLTEAVGHIQHLDSIWHFKNICVDQTGMGEMPTELLRTKWSGRVIGVTFTQQSKEEMYANLQLKMEGGVLKFPDHKKLVYQLLDLRYERSVNGRLKISHSERGHDDFPTALALAAWCMRPAAFGYQYAGVAGASWD